MNDSKPDPCRRVSSAHRSTQLPGEEKWIKNKNVKIKEMLHQKMKT